ncbi:uncharacterized protein MONOS_2227 [Monocercomonoides exilis]|uniref:uncharacterized protein n=1 Tax=Monocercomonoides exilis TaxID=2049356 RepID=UPI00355969B1|nr:hypothetical protein MONOS_2227 [Monocercomonoides exilis]|eukprot:MONOS_2227.1-p1 / transcript=MONOS_2227.1 / gene=MONOS_2227 / organism=Monocercomonoides_exilis_PA203 / gene_product=unspecified product / transcript_product=unspecified product / location=Mono_scaffold00044:139454-140872(+) / protein_length=473 / sequence_SO=supercontig / SO=protein_coding / is_pseudo=false
MILSGNSALFTFTVSPEDTVRAAFNFCTFKDITLSETGKLISYLNETHTNKNSLDEVQSSTKSLPSLESHSLHLTELPFHNKSSADENLSCLNFTSANVSLISNKPTTTKFISLLRCPSASINNCLISFSEESHSNIALCSKALTHLSEGEDNSMCSWENSLLEFVESNVSIINTNFSTKEMGAITLANGKLELDSVSLSGNFAGITSFPNIAHNIICLNDGSITLTNVGPETESNETFKNYWIMKNQCNLVGFPENLPSYLFVPIPEGVTRTKKENAVDVSLTGKYLINCNLQMAILIGNSSTVTNPLDMSVKETATITDNPHEGIITAEFSSDSIFGIDDNMYVFASLTIENTENPNKSYFTPPILIPRTKPRKPLSPLALSLIIGFSAVIASLILILFFIILRYKKIKRRRLDEAKASSDQNSSNKSSDISQNSQQKSQYRIVLRPVQGLDDEGIVYFPKDEQEPFFED